MTLNNEVAMKACPFPDNSPYGDIGKHGSPDAYLIDPGSGSGSDRVSRFWPARHVLDDIARRGGSITPLYSRTASLPSDAIKRGVGERLSAALWPILGGNHTSAETWHEISDAIERAIQGEG